jgi:hypothetical protein
MAAALALLALLVGTAHACLLPPRGCVPDKCSLYAGMKIPGNGNWGDVATWKPPFDKLAFVRSSFNKHLAPVGPSPVNLTTWLMLGTKYASQGCDLDNLPSLQFEYYLVDLPTIRTAAPDYNADIPTCCNGCRMTEDCNMYQYVPAVFTPNANVTGGTCYFVTSGNSTRDGPYGYTNATTDLLIGSPLPLPAGPMNSFWNQGKYNVAYGGKSYQLLFQGGYCQCPF